MGEIKYNDIVYLTKYIKILSLQHVINIKLLMRHFTFFFFCTKSLKPDGYITLITHLGLDWLHSSTWYLHAATIPDSIVLSHVTCNIVNTNLYLH